MVNLRFQLVIVGLCFGLFQTSALAWWDQGHETISKIAEDVLTSKARRKIKFLLDYPLAAPGSLVLTQSTNQMTFAASWADHIKQHFFDSNSGTDPYGSGCHYTNVNVDKDEIQTLSQDPTEIQKRVLLAAVQGKNSISCSKEFIQILAKQAKKNNRLKQNIYLSRQAIALRYLVHVIGDIHQPLHNFTVFRQKKRIRDNRGSSLLLIPVVKISLFSSPEFPEEDDSTLVKSLHFLWDSGLGAFKQLPHFTFSSQEDLKKLGSPPELEYITQTAKTVETSFNPVALISDEENLALEKWTTEGILLGLNSAYSHLKLQNRHFPFFSHISQPASYTHDGQIHVVQQLGLAGYRLGFLLNAIFDPENAPESFVRLIKSIRGEN